MDKPKILIVDDDSDVVETIGKYLERNLECSVYRAEDGRKAFEHIEKEVFDLAILDVKMPGISGIDVLKRLKAAHPKAHALMISAWDSQQVALTAIKEGATDYIVKPSGMEVIFPKVKAILEKLGKFFPKISAKNP